MLFTESIWQEWTEKIEEDFEVKGYDHFDFRFDFPKRKDEIKILVSNPDEVVKHSFLPFIKIKIKTPRYKFQDSTGTYELETKVRPISFASHLDTYIYSFYSFSLNKLYQDYIHRNGFSEAVLAYRTDLDGKSNIQFAKEVFDFIRGKGTCTAIALDIKGYFDNIDHFRLKEMWCKVIGATTLPEDQYRIFRSLTRYAYVNKDTLLKHFNVDLRKTGKKPTLLDYVPGTSFKAKFDLLRESNIITVNDSCEDHLNGRKRYFGIPQGSSISALLSNIYLIDYDLEMMSLAKKSGYLYRRYCDDILIVVNSNDAARIKDEAIRLIESFDLVIQEKKAEIITRWSACGGDRRKVKPDLGILGKYQVDPSCLGK